MFDIYETATAWVNLLYQLFTYNLAYSKILIYTKLLPYMIHLWTFCDPLIIFFIHMQSSDKSNTKIY